MFQLVYSILRRTSCFEGRFDDRSFCFQVLSVEFERELKLPSNVCAKIRWFKIEWDTRKMLRLEIVTNHPLTSWKHQWNSWTHWRDLASQREIGNNEKKRGGSPQKPLPKLKSCVFVCLKKLIIKTSLKQKLNASDFRVLYLKQHSTCSSSLPHPES